jgi:hypothetical protein
MLTEIELLEYRLCDLSSRCEAGSQQQRECEEGLVKLRGFKSKWLQGHPEILRKTSMEKRTGALDQAVHDVIKAATAGHACASYAARKAVRSGTVSTADSALHGAHHALVDAGRCKCDMAAAAGEPVGKGSPSPFSAAEAEGQRMARETRDRAAHETQMAKRAKMERKMAKKLRKAAHPAAWGLDDSFRTLVQGQTMLGSEQKLLESLRPSQLQPSSHPAFARRF